MAIKVWGGKKKEFAEAAGIHPVMLSKYLHGVCSPSTTTLMRMAEVLGVEPYLIRGDYEDEDLELDVYARP